PAQRLLQRRGGLGHLAARVRVRDSQPELPALVPGEQPVEEGGANVPDVQETGRARSHTDANGHAVRLLPCSSAPIAQAESRRRSTRPWTWAPRRCSFSHRARAPGAFRTTIQTTSLAFASGERRPGSLPS